MATKKETKRTRVVLNQVRKIGETSNSYDVLVNESRPASDSSSIVTVSQEYVVENDDAYIVSKGRLILLNSAWFGIMLTMMVMIVAAIPAQISYLVGRERKAHTLALLATLCSISVLLLAPIFGYVSDNYRSKYGRRRIFMIIGIVMSCVGLLLAGLIAPFFSAEQQLNQEKDIDGFANLTCNATKPQCSIGNSSLMSLTSMEDMGKGTGHRDIALYMLAAVIYFTGSTWASTAFTGLIADKTHPSARGFSSGIMGVMILSGNMAGAGIGILADKLLVVGTFAVLSIISLISVFVTCFFIPETPSDILPKPKQQESYKSVLSSFIRPFRSSDFTYLFLSRFLLQMGLASSVGFLEYWLDDVVYLPNCMSPMRAVSLLFIPMMVCGAISSGIGGLISDRIQKRKIFVYFSGVTMASCVCMLIFVNVYWMAIVLMVIIGIGYGAYIAVDMAMAFDILPSAAERAKDLAVWHQSLLLPQIIATPLGGVIVHGFQHLEFSSGAMGCEYALGYKILFGVTAAYFLVSLTLIMKIRGVA